MKKLFYLLIAFALLSGNGYAKETGEIVLDEIMVTATKTEEKRRDIPNSVIILNQTDIKESSAKSLGELLANESGIDWRVQGNYGGAPEAIHIRGMRSNEIQIFVNGVSANSPSLGSADVSRIPLNNIERIEIVKGAASLLYGSGAMAGAINIITKKPKPDETILKIKAGWSVMNSYELSAEHGKFVNDNFGYYISADKRGTDGFRDNSELAHNDISLKLFYDQGEKFYIDFYNEYINREYGIPGIKPPAGTKSFGIGEIEFYNQDSASLLDRGTNKDYKGSLNIKTEPFKKLSLNVKPYYSDMKSYNYSRNAGPVWPQVAGEGIKSWVNDTISGIDTDIKLDIFDGAALLLGASYKDHKWDTKSIYLNAVGAEKPGATLNNASLYTKSSFMALQYRPSEFFKILAGIRNEVHSTFGSENIPHYGLIINPFKTTVLKLNHGKHFKAPTPNDLFWPEDMWARGNPNLRPQTGWHSDISIEQSLFENLFLSLSYFKWDVKDKITWGPNPAFNDKWTPVNMNKSGGYGWEAGIAIKPTNKLSLAFNYTYTVVKDEIENITRDAQYMAENRFKAALTYDSGSDWTCFSSIRYTGERNFYRSQTDKVPTDILDSFGVVDIKFEKYLSDNLIFSFQVNNLFDEHYDTAVEYFFDNMGSRIWGFQPGAERSMFLNLSYEY